MDKDQPDVTHHRLITLGLTGMLYHLYSNHHLIMAFALSLTERSVTLYIVDERAVT